MGSSNVRRWVKHFKDGNTDIADQPRCGRPRTAATESNKQKVDEFIRQDRRITGRETAAQLGVGSFLRVQKRTKSVGTALPSTLQSEFDSLRLQLVRSLEISPEKSP
jgi:transposase